MHSQKQVKVVSRRHPLSGERVLRMNTNIGKGEVAGVVGYVALRVRNKSEERIIKVCQELRPRKLFTPTNNNQRIVRNQIDFMMIKRKYRNVVMSCKTYPGADILSAHNLLLVPTKL